MKAAPFKRRVEDALEVARKAGVAVVEITTADGATYKFKFNAEAEVPTAEGEDTIGDKIRKWKRDHETQSKSQIPKAVP